MLHSFHKIIAILCNSYKNIGTVRVKSWLIKCNNWRNVHKKWQIETCNKTKKRYFHIWWRKQKTEKCHKFVLSVSNFSKTFVINAEMQQIGNKKVICRRTRGIICNSFDYMRITFPFEPLTKNGFLKIYFFNQFRENLNLPRHSFLRRLWEIWHRQYIFVTFLSFVSATKYENTSNNQCWESVLLPVKYR
jgi:hypothetical protein